MADVIQRNFAGGELAPGLYVRADQVKYMTGCRTALNMFVRKTGGLSNRAGTRYVSDVYFAGSDRNVRLQKFVFDQDQSYVLVHTEGVFRVIKNGAVVQVTSVPAYSGGTSYTSGDYVSYNGVNYVSKLDSNVGHQPDIWPTYWHPLTGTNFEQYTGYLGPALPYLKWQQSLDYLYCALNDGSVYHYPAAQIVRRADNKWSFTTISFQPVVGPPTTINTTFPAGTKTIKYKLTSVATGNYEESLESAAATCVNSLSPTDANPITVTWTAVSGAAEYNVYRELNGKYGFIGTAVGTTFVDTGFTPNTAITPPADISGPVDPAAVGIIQQRLCFASSPSLPEKVWMSRIGQYKNFYSSIPTQDDDSINFNLVGGRINRVRALLEVGMPLMFTQSGEWVLMGDADNTITPTAITPRQQAYNGLSDKLPPVVIDDTVVYVQARGNIVRDLKYKIEGDGYTGRDLSVFSDHLFKGKKITAIDYAQNPNPLVWCALNDGTFVSLSYLREHEIWGWTRHQTDGFVVDLCVVPEGVEDYLYLVVRRTINGVTKYCIERMESRTDTDLASSFFVDCGLSYDGRNTTGTTMRMLPQASMTTKDWFVLEASASFFSSTDVGNAIVLYSGTKSLTLNIRSYLSATQVKVEPNRDLTGTNADATFAAWVDIATTTWAKAVDDFSGLGHLEGKYVAILADGGVVSNGYEAPLYQVVGGAVSIPRPAVRVHIGLPYVSDFESLDVDLRDQPLRQKSKLVTHVGVMVEKTSALKAGTSFDELTEYKIRDEADTFGEPTALKTGFFDAAVASGWDEETRVCVRQDNPLPFTINAIIPRYIIGG